MSDFSGDFWSYCVAAIAVISIIACAVLLSTGRARLAGEPGVTPGHT